MRLTSRIARRAFRGPRFVLRCRGLTVEPLEDRLLLSPLPGQSTSLSAVQANGIYAGTATLTATLTTAGKPLAGATVAFALDEANTLVNVGSATTDISGLATLPDVALTGFNAGIAADAVAASFAGDATDSATTASGPLMVSPAQATLTLDGLVGTYNGAAQAAGVSITPAGLAGVSVTYIQNRLTVAAPTLAGSYAVTATLDNPNYSATAATGTLILNPATPTITWANPADIVYGTPLGPVQLDATSSVAGTFGYTQTTGIVLNAGAAQELSATFTPIDTVDYNSVTTTVTLNVLPVTPTITWANPADIVYGTPLSPAQLDAAASIPGTFTYMPLAGTVLGARVAQALSVTFTPIDTTDAIPVTTTATINILPATPAIAWTNPPDIDYGTPLGPAQLDAAAAIPGTFTYTPAVGTVLNAGADQALAVSFTPADTADYDGNTASVLINVVQAPLTVTVNDATRVYGQANPAFSVSYSGFVGSDTPSVLGGVLLFSTPATPASDTGSYEITASGLSASNYTIRPINGTLSITPADQTIVWSNPADIIYGTPLDAAQLNATVSVVGPAPAGPLSYSPVARTVLNAGDDQMLTVQAAATNDYNAASATEILNVALATPTITWAVPADIIFGTPLGPAQLDASVSTSGPTTVALDYSPPAGTVLQVGSGQALMASTEATANDTAATQTVTINVLPATPTITWANPADIVYGTPLSPAQLDATASIAGTFTFSPTLGDILEAGPAQILTATFTPADPADFQSVMVTTLINVARVPLVVTAADAATTYGAPVPMLSGSVVGLVNNDPVGITFTTAADVGSPVGTYAITPTLVDPNDRMGNYQVELDYGTLTVSPAPLTVTSSSASTVVGQALPAFAASYDGFLLGDGPNVLGGTLTFSLTAGAASRPGLFAIMPGGLSAANYTITYVDGFLSVAPQPAPSLVMVQNITWQTHRANHGKSVRVLVLTFSGALDTSDAQDLEPPTTCLRAAAARSSAPAAASPFRLPRPPTTRPPTP